MQVNIYFLMIFTFIYEKMVFQLRGIIYRFSSFNYNRVSRSCELNDALYDEELSDVIPSFTGWVWYNRRV